MAAGVAVQEEEGLGALDDEVVDVHGDKVDANCVVDAHGVGDLELGADAVNGTDQRRREGVVVGVCGG